MIVVGKTSIVDSVKVKVCTSPGRVVKLVRVVVVGTSDVSVLVDAGRVVVEVSVVVSNEVDPLRVRVEPERVKVEAERVWVEAGCVEMDNDVAVEKTVEVKVDTASELQIAVGEGLTSQLESLSSGC